MTDVLIKRELLERVAGMTARSCISAMDELRAILAAPRQPEGEGLEVWGNKYRVNFMGQEFLCSDPKGRIVIETIPLCRLSDAQRAIAELRDRLNATSQCADNYSRMFEESSEEMEAAASQAEYQHGRAEHFRAQRDRLAGLLADVKADYTHAIHWEDMHATMKRIDAALAEVEPCPESPAPTT